MRGHRCRAPVPGPCLHACWQPSGGRRDGALHHVPERTAQILGSSRACHRTQALRQFFHRGLHRFWGKFTCPAGDNPAVCGERVGNATAPSGQPLPCLTSRLRGNHRVTVVPRPGSLSSVRVPPCRSTSRRDSGSPSPGAFVAARHHVVHLLERRHDAVDVGLGDPDPGIAHRHGQTVRADAALDGNPPALAGELHRIGQKIEQDLLDPYRISGKPGAGSVAAGFQP